MTVNMNAQKRTNVNTIAGSAVAGAGLVGTTAYLTTSFMKNDEPKDKFIASITDEMLKLKDKKKYCGAFNNIKKLSKKLDNINDDDKLKKMFKRFGSTLDFLDDVDRRDARNSVFHSDEQCFSRKKDSIKKLLDGSLNGIRSTVSDEISELWDGNSKKWKNTSDDAETMQFISAAKKATQKIKLKSAGFYGTIGAIIAGTTAYFLTKNSNKN